MMAASNAAITIPLTNGGKEDNTNVEIAASGFSSPGNITAIEPPKNSKQMMIITDMKPEMIKAFFTAPSFFPARTLCGITGSPGVERK